MGALGGLSIQSATLRSNSKQIEQKLNFPYKIFQEILTTIKNTSLRKENCKQPSPVD